MENYELVLILSEKLKDAAQKKVLEYLTSLLKKLGGEFGKIEEWGKKKFTYKLKNQTQGYYFFAQLTLDKAKTAEFNRALQTNDNIIKHLLVKSQKKRNEGEKSKKTTKKTKEVKK